METKHVLKVFFGTSETVSWRKFGALRPFPFQAFLDAHALFFQVRLTGCLISSPETS